ERDAGRERPGWVQRADAGVDDREVSGHRSHGREASTLAAMNRPLVLAACVAALLAGAAPAHAKAPSCTRGGAKVLFADQNLDVVSITPKQHGGSVPKDKVY